MTFKMAVVRYFEFSAFEIFILDRHYSRILHLCTQFCENWTISCRLMAQTTFSGSGCSAQVCYSTRTFIKIGSSHQ